MRPCPPHRTSRRRRAEPGFTLVELLIVIGIIAVLISILLPALNRARAAANSVKCQANLRSIGQAIALYAVQSKGVIPYGWFDGSRPDGTFPPGGATVQMVKWPALLLSALSSKFSATANDSRETGGNTTRLRSMFFCPEVGAEDTMVDAFGQSHYACHPRLMPPVGWAAADSLEPGTRNRNKTYRLAKLKRASEIGIIFDSSLGYNTQTNKWAVVADMPVAVQIGRRAWYGSYAETRTFLLDTKYNKTSPPMNPNDSINMQVQNPNLPGGPNSDYILTGPDNSPTAQTSNTYNIRFRHMNNTVANMLMVDGHVQSFTYDKRLAPNHPRVTSMPWKTIHVPPP